MLAGDYAMGGHRRRQVKSGFYSRQRNIYTLFSFTVVSVFVVYIISCSTILDIFLVLESDGCEILNIDFFFVRNGLLTRLRQALICSNLGLVVI